MLGDWLIALPDDDRFFERFTDLRPSEWPTKLSPAWKLPLPARPMYGLDLYTPKATATKSEATD